MAPTSEQRVIVGLNGSDGDPRAVRTALELARALDTTLYAVDVKPRRAGTASDRRGAPRMQDAYFALSKAGGIPDDADVRIVVVDGEPSEQLVRLADRPTDFLVVARGAGDERAIASSCVANARCPVVVVPPTDEPLEPAAAGHTPSQRRIDRDQEMVTSR